MPVFISREQQCNSDVHVKDKVSTNPSLKSEKTFSRTTKKENKHHNSEQNLFRIRKKYCRSSFLHDDKSTCVTAKKVLKDKNRQESLQFKKLTHHTVAQFSIKTESATFKDGEALQSKDVALKQQNQKRKIYETICGAESLEKCKLQKLLSNCEGLENMYDYRHQMTNVSKNEGDSNYLNKNDAAEENLINAFYQQQHLGGNNSIATLCNIGNSCYLNSVIYTLRFAPHFLHKLHHLVEDMRQVYQKIGQHKLKSSSLGRNVSGIQNHNGRSWSSKDLVSLNGTNSNGVNDPTLKCNRQIATEKLHELYQSLHRNETIDTLEHFHAGTFLQAIQDVSSVFEGNQQQDAHELLMCILDSIRETCSTLIKTIKENPEIMNQNVQIAESNELTSPPQSNVNSSQSLKSIFSRKIRRKDTMKNNNVGTSSPIKENVADNVTTTTTTVVEEEPSVETNKVNVDTPAVDNNEKVNEAIKRLGLDFFCKDFEGITLFTTKCLTCETVTEQKETMVDIAIPMSHESLTQPIDPQLFFQVRHSLSLLFFCS